MFSPKHIQLRLTLLLFGFTASASASISEIFIAQDAVGAAAGLACSSAKGASFFNTASNWGTASGQIGPGTVVHLCGTWLGGNGATLLTFQGSGSPGSPITLLFERGAVMQPNYCAGTGCIDLNGRSHLIIDGGAPCGETAKWSVTSCNGVIRNLAVGSPQSACPNGQACVPIGGSVSSVAIGTSTGSPSYVEIRNLKLGPLFTRSPSDTSDNGMATCGIGLARGTFAQQITAHHMIFTGMAKGYLVSLGTGAGTVSGYHVYSSNFSDQCWAMGVGANAPDMNVSELSFHDNEVSGWDAWAVANTSGNVCHTNGTMWFNGDGYAVHSESGFIGGPLSGIYNNYLHGDLTGGVSFSSPSGMLSCQDNCIDIFVVNNVLDHSCTGTNPARGCSGLVYFNGAGGGGQRVFNNTLVARAGSCVVATGETSPVTVQNNIYVGCSAAIEIRPNAPRAVVANFNDGFNIGSSSWMVYNSAASGVFQTLAQYRSNQGQDTASVTGDPRLDAAFRPQPFSAALKLGVNLTTLGIEPLNSDAAGVLRPQTGAWDAGAFNFRLADALAPAPPENFNKQ